MASDTPPLDHWNYDELDDPDTRCTCYLCERHRAAEQAFRDSLDKPAVVRRPIQTALIAVAMKRDLYSELSFLVRTRSWREEFLAWILVKIEGPKGDWWWAYHSEKRILADWISEWYEAVYRPRKEAEAASLMPKRGRAA